MIQSEYYIVSRQFDLTFEGSHNFSDWARDVAVQKMLLKMWDSNCCILEYLVGSRTWIIYTCNSEVV